MNYTDLFFEQYVIEGNTSDQTIIICRPLTKCGYFGDLISIDTRELVGVSFPVLEDPTWEHCAKPLKFREVFDFSSFKSPQKFKIYEPVAPEGFVALGCVIADSVNQIPSNLYCIRKELVTQANNEEIIMYSPQAQPLKFIRNRIFCFYIDNLPYLPIQMPNTDRFNDIVEFLEPLQQNSDGIIEDGKGIAVRTLPVLEIGNMISSKTANIDPDANDTMTEIKIVQQPQQFADFLVNAVNPVKFKDDAAQHYEILQKAIGFELIGVTSLTRPQIDSGMMVSVSETSVIDEQDQKHEDYLYIFYPIAPPGYIPLGITTSVDENPTHEVYCVNEKCVLWTDKVQYELGKVYDKNTASFIQNYMQIIELPIEDKNKRLRSFTVPDLSLIQLVIPKQSIYINIKADKYPVLKPQYTMFLYSDNHANQKSILKAIKCEAENERACQQILLNEGIMNIYRPKLHKNTYNYLLYYRKIEKYHEDQQEISQRIQLLQNQLNDILNSVTPAPSEANKKTPSRGSKQAARGKEEQPVQEQNQTEIPAEIPLEMQIFDHTFVFENFSVSQPVGYQVILQLKQPDGKMLNFIKIIAPDGYCALSDVVFEGDDLTKFDLSRHYCVNKFYCNQFILQPHIQLQNEYYLMKYPLPLGTDTLMDSGFQCLHIRNVNKYEQLVCWQLRDQIYQALFQQEKKQSLLKYSKIKQFNDLEVNIIVKNALELNLCDESLITSKYKIGNMDPEKGKDIALFGTLITEALKDIPDEEINSANRSESPMKLDTTKYMQKIMTVQQFENQYSNNLLFAKPTGFKKLNGHVSYENKKLYGFKLIAPPGYVALGDVMSEVEDIQPILHKFICVHKEFVDFKHIYQPKWLINGHSQSENLWVFIIQKQNNFCQLFDEYVDNFQMPVLKNYIVDMVYSSMAQKGYYPNTEQTYLINPKPLIQYIYNYCQNNKTTIVKQRYNDLGCHNFDGKLVVDEFLQQKNCMMVSVGQLKVYNTYQVVTSVMATTLLQQIKQRDLKQQEIKFEMVSEKIKIIEQLIIMFENIGRFTSIIQYGRANYYCLEKQTFSLVSKVNQILYTPRGKVSRATMSALLDYRIPLPGYIVVSDKIPLNMAGGIFENKPIYYHILLKCLAKTVGGYTQLFQKDITGIIDAFMNLFGYSTQGEIIIFRLYYNNEGDLKINEDDDVQQQRSSWNEITIYII